MGSPERRRSRSSERERKKSSSSKDRRKSRSRSRSRDRSRRRDRSRSPRRERKASLFDTAAPAVPTPAPPDPAKQAALLAQQQQLAQQWILQQQQQTAIQTGTAAGTNKKQREVYCGNLTVGLVTPQMLQELFNGALLPCSKDGLPPVVNVSMNSDGKFAFVELRTEELSALAMNLDKVELCGRAINVGRPRGYIDPSTPGGYDSGFPQGGGQPQMGGMPGGFPQPGMGMPGMGGMPGGPMAGMMGPVTPASTCLYLENLATLQELQDATERAEIEEDVKEECKKFGQVLHIHVPTPTPDAMANNEPGRVYAKFIEQAGAIAAQRALNNRTFSGNKVMATFIPETDFDRAMSGEWLPAPPKPVPAEGVIKMRGLPFTATKQDIVLFFQGFGLSEDKVRIVYGRDSRPTGEAYSIFEGPGADVRGALSKHRMMLGTRYVELFPSSKEELEQFSLSGNIVM